MQCTQKSFFFNVCCTFLFSVMLVIMSRPLFSLFSLLCTFCNHCLQSTQNEQIQTKLINRNKERGKKRKIYCIVNNKLTTLHFTLKWKLGSINFYKAFSMSRHFLNMLFTRTTIIVVLFTWMAIYYFKIITFLVRTSWKVWLYFTVQSLEIYNCSCNLQLSYILYMK